MQGVWMTLMLASVAVASSDFSSLDVIKSLASETTQADAATALIKRLVPGHAVQFTVTVSKDLSSNGKDVVLIKNRATLHGIHITGSSGVAVAMGFYYYLKKHCNAHISWAGDQVALPSTLPVVSTTGIRVTSNDRLRYYQNVCTVSYSFVWWDWARWQREIDWMAMQGINFPLAFNAQEAVWQRVYLKLGFKQKELDEHFVGPAFLAWQRMGNMEGWGGVLTDNWHKQQIALQHQILKGMRDLGMTPIVPAFAGHVPKAIKRAYPYANTSQLRDWGHFTGRNCCTTFLEPTDPLFGVIGKQFITEYTGEFGTNHAYNCDAFNEMTPRSAHPDYLAAAGKGIFEAMTSADPDAIWVMQGWLFLNSFWQEPQMKALLQSVPRGRMIVLDLYSEVTPIFSKSHSYYSQPFIWNMLHNFGGNLALYGVIDEVNVGPFKGRKFADSSMVGIGLTPEGINQNDVMYEFMMENAWRSNAENLTQWFSNYALRRYGKRSDDAEVAWQLLKGSVYNCTTGMSDHNKYVIVISRP